MINQYKQLKHTGNANAVANMLLRQNPQVQSIISQYGSINGAIDALCKQQGINTQEFMNALK